MDTSRSTPPATVPIRWDLIRRYVGFFAGSRRALILLVAMTIVVGASSACIPLLFQLIERGFRSHSGDQIVSGLGLFAGLRVVQAVLQALSMYLQQCVNTRVHKTILVAFYARVHDLPIRFLETLEGKGEIYQRVCDLVNLQYTFTHVVLTSVNDVILTIMYLVILGCVNPLIPAVVLVGFTVFLVLSSRSAQIVQHKARAAREGQSALVNYLFQAIQGLHTIRALAAADHVNHVVEQSSERVRHTDSALQAAQIRMEALTQAVTEMMLLLIVGSIAWLVFRGHAEIASLLATYTIASSLMGPLRGLAGVPYKLQEANPTLIRAFELLDHPPEGAQESRDRTLSSLQGRIEFESVWFSYQPDQPVLRGVSFVIPAGCTAALVGRSGAGKTTILKLLLGFYQPDVGRILIDGVDLRDVDLTWWRSRLGVVLQSDLLFKGSIRDNLILGMDRPGSDVQLIQALQDAQLWEFVTTQPQGIDTVVDAESLSGGQRQRLVLARAFVRKPQLLCLDEPVAALDPQTEELVHAALKRLLQGRTGLLVAHRHTTIRQADQVLVVDGGVIAEQGRHDALLGQRGLYHRLYEDESWL